MATPPPGEPLVASIDSMTPPVIEEVPFSLFAQHERKTTNLINNSPNKITLKSQNRFYDFYFSEPLFINIIEIETQEFVESSRFEYYWIGIDDRKYEGDSSTHNNIISIEINGIAKSISIKPPKAYFTKPQIQCVKIFGFNISQAGDFIKFSDKLEKEKSDIVLSINRELSDLEKKRIEVSGLQAQRGTIQQDISSHKNSVAREQSKLKNLEIKKNELITQNGEFERSNVNLQLSIEKAKAESSKLAALRSNLSKSVQTKNSKLTALVSDIHLFPSELSGFSKQGAQDARTFFWLSPSWENSVMSH